MRNEPMGLPEGTVRAAVTIIIVGTACAVLIQGKSLQPELALAFGTAITYYYESRKNAAKSNAQKSTPESTPEKPEENKGGEQ